jgi:hypothetical protein
MMFSNTKSLLVVTAIAEIGAGLGLLIAPSVVVRFLLGAGLESPESILLGKIAGSALLAIGLSCWLSRNEASGLVAGLLLYNAALVILFLDAGLIDKMQGIGIWPAVGVHGALAIWCTARLRAGRGGR